LLGGLFEAPALVPGDELSALTDHCHLEPRAALPERDLLRLCEQRSAHALPLRLRANRDHPDMRDLRGLALSGDGETLYVLTGDGIDAFAVVTFD